MTPILLASTEIVAHQLGGPLPDDAVVAHLARFVNDPVDRLTAPPLAVNDRKGWDAFGE